MHFCSFSGRVGIFVDFFRFLQFSFSDCSLSVVLSFSGSSAVAESLVQEFATDPGALASG